MIFTASKEIEFDAGHRVPNHVSKCANPHGHRYRVQATVQGQLVDKEGASSEGMVMDFGDLKSVLVAEVHDRFDHGFIVWEHDQAMRDALAGHGWKVLVVPCVPTAENLAALIFADVDTALRNYWGTRCRLTEVALWETPTSCATVRPA